MTDEQVKEEFDKRVAAQKESYDAAPAGYVTAENNGTTNYYVPEGYRGVKNLLIQLQRREAERNQRPEQRDFHREHHAERRAEAARRSEGGGHLFLRRGDQGAAMTSRLRRSKRPWRPLRRRWMNPARSWRP